MKKRLWWSMLFSSAALLVTSVTMFAQRPTVAIYNDPVGRAPSSTSTLTPRIPATYSGQAGATDFVAWEGFNSTNYLNRVQLQFSPNFADIAVGPTDILTIVNRRIARWRNPKAKGAAAITSTFEPPTNEALLDSWLGTAVLNQLCPTLPRSTFSCLIDSATIRYDQMHGRFVVLMTVIDTVSRPSVSRPRSRVARTGFWPYRSTPRSSRAAPARRKTSRLRLRPVSRRISS